MSLEERLEAIAQHVQTMSGMKIETEKRVARLEESTIRLNEVIVRFVELLGRHEERPDDLEERNRPKQ